MQLALCLELISEMNLDVGKKARTFSFVIL